MEPQYVKLKDLPKDATLVGKLNHQEAIPIEPCFTPHDVVRDQEFDYTRKDFIRRANKDYAVDGKSLSLVETKAYSAYDVAGVRVDIQADVYRV